MNKLNNTWHGIKTFEWKSFEWVKRPLWGLAHSQENTVWTDENLPYFINDVLYLPIKYDPKEHYNKIYLYSRGLVRSVEEWKYGIFEWDVILPEGKYFWPAIWLTSDKGWPPEIDVLEGWSGNHPQYVKRFLFKHIKPTMHWSKNADELNGEHLSNCRNNLWRWYIKANRQVNHLKCVWTPEYVDIFYNKYKVKRFKNKEMLEHFNKPDYKMHAIMSANVYGDYWMEKAQYQPTFFENEELVIKDFSYQPL